jgi:hypothetical protein
VYFTGAAVAGWRQEDELQSSRLPHGKRFAKVGVGIRGTAPVTLRVPPAGEGSVSMTGWSLPGGANRESKVIWISQRIDGRCADAEWRMYPGGLEFRGPQCLRLIVEAGGRTAGVPFGLGRPCPGGRPFHLPSG